MKGYKTASLRNQHSWTFRVWVVINVYVAFFYEQHQSSGSICHFLPAAVHLSNIWGSVGNWARPPTGFPLLSINVFLNLKKIKYLQFTCSTWTSLPVFCFITFPSNGLTGVILGQSALAVTFYAGCAGGVFHYDGLCFSMLPVILVYYLF